MRCGLIPQKRSPKHILSRIKYLNRIVVLVFCVSFCSETWCQEPSGITTPQTPSVSVSAKVFPPQPDWLYKIPLMLPKSYAPWEDRQIGVVELYHGGYASPDASNVVVADQTGPQPFCILQAGPGDFIRIAFSWKHLPSLAVYFRATQPKADSPTAADSLRPYLLPTSGWKPTAGLLLTTWPLPANAPSPDSWKNMQAILAACSSEQPYGTDFVEAVYHGYHPFSASDKFVSVYQGWLGCPADGEYSFATSSDDASFLWVNETLVAEFPGVHPAVSDARHQGKIHLTKGVHRLAYYHVNAGGPTITCAAWQPPGKPKIDPITWHSFAPVAQMKPVSLWKRSTNGVYEPDPAGILIVENMGESWIDERQLLRYRFSAATAGKKIFSWQLGDGISVSASATDHIYLSTGIRTIVADRLTNRVLIQPDYSRALSQQFDSPETYRKLLSAYSFDTMNIADLIALLSVFDSVTADAKDVKKQICETILARKPDTPLYHFQAAMQLGELLRDHFHQPEEAVRIYRNVVETPLGRQQKARLIREIGDTLFYYIKDLDAALNEYDKVVGRYADVLEANIVRVTKIKIGDIFRQRGDGEKARQAYQNAAELLLYTRTFAQDTVRKGGLYKTVDDFLKRKVFDEAQRWLEILEWEYPLEKLDGYSSILRANIAEQRGNLPEAQKQLLWYVTANPKSAYAAEALYHSARLFALEKQPNRVEQVIQKLTRDYAESIYAQKAALLRSSPTTSDAM